jgi:hypothetical protein
LQCKLHPFVERRLAKLVSAPFFAIMIISNIYFLSNIETGNYFFKRMLFVGPTPLLPLLVVMYCGCVVSEHRQIKESASKSQ